MHKWHALATAMALVAVTAACGPNTGTTPEATAPPSQTSMAGDGASTGPSTGSPTGSSAGHVVAQRLDLDAVGDGATEHKLDLFLPQGQGDGPFPLVVWVHGGGWKGGDKSDIGRAEDIQMVRTKELLLSKGYAVASPNYHLLPDTTFPEPMQDVAAAVRYLRAHATEFGVDPQRFALMGDSAGAHLAAMTALTPDRADLQGSLGETGVNASVKAFVGYYGIYDLTARTRDQKEICGGGKPGAESSHGRLIGADPDAPEGAEKARTASPVTYASATSPAVLLFSGREDCTAPYPQAERFAQALKGAGATAEITLIDKAHGDQQFFTDPALQHQLITFLDAHVKG